MKTTEELIRKAAKAHISGTRSDGFDPEPSDVEAWDKSSLPQIDGLDQDDVRDLLRVEIKRQLDEES